LVFTDTLLDVQHQRDSVKISQQVVSYVEGWPILGDHQMAKQWL